MPETNLKNGDVSAYGFMCGYCQDANVGKIVQVKNPFGGFSNQPRFKVRLFAEGSVYHIQISDWLQYFGLREWESYDTLSEARTAFRKAKKFYSENDPEPYEDRRFFLEDEGAEWEKQ